MLIHWCVVVVYLFIYLFLYFTSLFSPTLCVLGNIYFLILAAEHTLEQLSVVAIVFSVLYPLRFYIRVYMTDYMIIIYFTWKLNSLSSICYNYYLNISSDIGGFTPAWKILFQMFFYHLIIKVLKFRPCDDKGCSPRAVLFENPLRYYFTVNKVRLT